MCILKITFAVPAFSRQAQVKSLQGGDKTTLQPKSAVCPQLSLTAVDAPSQRWCCWLWGSAVTSLWLQALVAKTCNEKVMTENLSREKASTDYTY